MLTPLPGYAQAKEDWPDPIYFPQALPKPPQPPQWTGPGHSESEAAKDRKGIWPFKRKSKTKKAVAPADGRGMKVDPPPSPDPMLRIGLPFRDAENNWVPAGIYLVKPLGVVENGQLSLALTRQAKAVLRFTAHEAANVDENMARTGTPSPLEYQDKQRAEAGDQAKLRLNPAKDQLVIIYQRGSQRFESPPFAVMTDPRPVLKF